MLSSGQQAADFIKVLAPTVKAAGLNVKLTCCDATGYNAQKKMLPGLAAVDSLYDVVTTHGYSSDPTAPFASSKHAWMTETADLSGKWTASYYSSGAAGEGQTWAEKIYTGKVRRTPVPPQRTPRSSICTAESSQLRSAFGSMRSGVASSGRALSALVRMGLVPHSKCLRSRTPMAPLLYKS
jgi:hypothetical protein